MASVATKCRAENKSNKIKYKALEELEKGTPHKDVAFLFGVPKNTLPTWKKNSEAMHGDVGHIHMLFLMLFTPLSIKIR